MKDITRGPLLSWTTSKLMRFTLETGNLSALQLNKNSSNWAESHEKAFEKGILSFQTEFYSLRGGHRAKREFVILPTEE